MPVWEVSRELNGEGVRHGDTYGSLCMIEFYTSCQPTLCEQTKLRDDELVNLVLP